MSSSAKLDGVEYDERGRHASGPGLRALQRRLDPFPYAGERASFIRGEGADGVGWFYYSELFPDSGSVGPFHTRRAAADAARGVGYSVGPMCDQRGYHFNGRRWVPTPTVLATSMEHVDAEREYMVGVRRYIADDEGRLWTTTPSEHRPEFNGAERICVQRWYWCYQPERGIHRQRLATPAQADDDAEVEL